MNKQENITKIVAAGLCTGCGTCVAICPTLAVRMEETSSGLLFAKIDADVCNGCGLCYQACGGAKLDEGLISSDVDPFKGQILSAFCGHATDPAIRLRGQSGGVTTALLSYLFASGQIDRALVNHMPENGMLRPETFLARNKEDVIKSQGSKYCPVALNASIPKDIGEKGNKMALVGLPCHIHSLRNVQQFQKNWANGVGFTIGLFCDRTLSYGAIDYLIEKGGCSPLNTLSFRYKDKTLGEFPGPICIRTIDNKLVRLPSRERVAIKDFFTPPRCRVCFDKMNILSDISVGDAWGVKESKEGFSVLIAHTSKGLALIEEAQKNNYLSLIEIDPEKIFKGQGVEMRRKNWTAYTKTRVLFDDAVPDHHINLKFRHKNTSDIDNFVLNQYQWGKNYIGKKTSKQIIRKVKAWQFKNRIKQKLISVLNKLKF